MMHLIMEGAVPPPPFPRDEMTVYAFWGLVLAVWGVVLIGALVAMLVEDAGKRP